MRLLSLKHLYNCKCSCPVMNSHFQASMSVETLMERKWWTLYPPNLKTNLVSPWMQHIPWFTQIRRWTFFPLLTSNHFCINVFCRLTWQAVQVLRPVPSILKFVTTYIWWQQHAPSGRGPNAYIKLDEKIVAVVAELQDNQIPLLGGFLMFMMLLNIPFL